jgi:hypothetical protein
MTPSFDAKRNARESGYQNTPLFFTDASAGAGSTDNQGTLSQFSGPIKRLLDNLPTWAPFAIVGVLFFLLWKNR